MVSGYTVYDGDECVREQIGFFFFAPELNVNELKKHNSVLSSIIFTAEDKTITMNM